MAVEDRAAAARDANDLQDKVAERYAPRIARAISTAMRDVAEGLPTGRRPDPPPEHFRAIDDAMRGLYREITRDMAETLVDRFKSGFRWLETKADEDGFYERLYEQYMQSYGGDRIAQITGTTRAQIVRIIERGLRNGASVDEIAQEIVAVAQEVGETRAAIISRTETHSAAMFASLESARRSTVPLVKEWVSVEDARTRDFGEGDGVVDQFSHRIMDGVQVPLDDPFEVPTVAGGTERLMYPGDPAGSAANIINCRCAQVYTAADGEPDEDEPPPEPKPRQPGGPQFRYPTIADPAANLASVEAFVRDNGIADRADLKGISAKEIAPLMRHMLEVHERFDLDPLIGVGPATRFGMRRAGRANAAIYPVRERSTGRQGIWHMPTTFGSRKRYEQQRALAIKYADGYLRDRNAALTRDHASGANRIGDEVRNRIMRMDERRESGQSDQAFGFTLNAIDEPDLQRRKIIYHEYGHVVHLTNSRHPQMADEINTFLRQVRPRSGGWHLLLSKYAGSDDYEIVAESFSLYMTGPPDEYYRIHPELLAIFQRYDRAVTAKSFILQGPAMTKQDDPPIDDAIALIQTVLAADPAERRDLARRLLREYPGGDRELVEIWLDEALTLREVDTI